MRLIARLIPLVLCAVALGACHSSAYLSKHGRVEKCLDQIGYLAAQSAPALHTPAGLVPPNTKNALKIAEVTGTATARTTKEGCLDRPPTFFVQQVKPAAAVVPAGPRADPPAQ